MESMSIQRDVDNELYQTDYTKTSAKIKSIDEEDDDEAGKGDEAGENGAGREFEYNEVSYKGGRAKVNAYEDGSQYHYVRY